MKFCRVRFISSCVYISHVLLVHTYIPTSAESSSHNERTHTKSEKEGKRKHYSRKPVYVYYSRVDKRGTHRHRGGAGKAIGSSCKRELPQCDDAGAKKKRVWFKLVPAQLSREQHTTCIRRGTTPMIVVK